MSGPPVVMAVWCALAMTATTAGAQPLKDVFRRVNASVVLIRTTAKAPAVSVNGADAAPPEQGLGSGVLVSADGKVITAAHVVKADSAIQVHFLDGAPIAATVIAVAPFADLALLQLGRVPPTAAVATFGDSDLLDAGDQIFTVGAPYGANHSLAVGWISARRDQPKVYEDASALEIFQTDLDVFEGNSGGPLFTLDGLVVGIVTHVLSKEGATGGPSFSVTGNVAKRLLLDERRTWFGVESFMLEGPMADAFNLPQPAGLLVQAVAAGSLAARLGLRAGSLPATVADVPLLIGGDVVLEVLGTPVTTSELFMSGFLAALDRVKAGDTVTVRVWRGGKVVPLTTTAIAP